MSGTILNVITVAVGSLLGLLIGNRLSAKIQESVVTGLGLVTLFVGVSNAGKTGNVIIPLLSIYRRYNRGIAEYSRRIGTLRRVAASAVCQFSANPSA